MKRKTLNNILIVVGIGIAVYLGLRAALVPITIDESITFFKYVNKANWLQDGIWNANNHLLNTLMTMGSTKLFGTSEFALRLANLLGGLLYLTYAFRWSKRYEDWFSAISIFAALTTSQFVLDFFGLCRGYGISLGFSLMSWYHLSVWWKQRRTTDSILAILAACLATFANLSMYVPLLVSMGIIALGAIAKGENRNSSAPSLLGMLVIGGGYFAIHATGSKIKGRR